MPTLTISFHGMTLIGHGARGEAWLLDTDRIRVGHKHIHRLVIGDATVDLHGGKLVTFEDNGRRLDGPLTLGSEANEMIDLDVVLDEPVRLRPELSTDDPRPGGSWKELLAAWIRLPSGTVDARAEDFEVWTFPKSGARKLTEQFTITVPDVTAPSVRVTSPNGSTQRLDIPLDQGVYRLHVSTVFNGTPSPFPEINRPITLDEALLLYACATDGGAAEAAPRAFEMSSRLPSRIFTEADSRRLRLRRALTEDITVCPPGCISVDEASA